MNNKIITAFTKLINSDVLKNIYPMVDHITITKFQENPNFGSYTMSVNIYLNDPSINKNNMYKKELDPHYLTGFHIKNLAKYLGIELTRVLFKLFGPDGELLLDWD